jgi:hypothetical protein
MDRLEFISLVYILDTKMIERKDWEEIKKQSEDMIKRLTKDSEISLIASRLMLEKAKKELKRWQTNNMSKEEEKSTSS